MFSTARFPTFAVVVVVLLATFLIGATTLEAAGPSQVLGVPSSKLRVDLAIDLPDDLQLDPSDAWQLVEAGKPGSVVPVQLVMALAADGSAEKEKRRLVASIPPPNGASSSHRFRLEPAEARQGRVEPGFYFKEVSDKSLGLWDGDKPVLTYNHGMITSEDVPENDHRRSRACYVHPVWGLNGEVLTEDFPRDHYHHHGIFWTWPHVEIEGQEYDLWADRGIEQRFVRWICRQSGPVAAVLGVENGWFVSQQKVMIERVWLRAYKASSGNRSLDLEFAWIPTDKPVTLWGAPDKSYGGLTMRFAPPSRKDPNTVITVPSGPTEGDLPDTPLPWADFTSKFGDNPTPSGAAVFVDPGHPDYPPTWLTRHYGPLCVGWPGVNAKTFQPGKSIRLNYRIWIHKTAVSAEQLQQAYDAYVVATKVKWE